MNTLKSFDIVVALKVGLNERAIRERNAGLDLISPNSVSELSEALHKAKGDISRAINRLIRSGLIAERQPRDHDVLASNRKYYSVQRKAFSDFLCFGIRHVFVPEESGFGRGMLTGWSCPLVHSPLNPPEVPLVWPMPGGDAQGEFIEPLYAKCVLAAKQDSGLYQLLSLVDVIRTGKPRELKYVKELIRDGINELYS